MSNNLKNRKNSVNPFAIKAAEKETVVSIPQKSETTRKKTSKDYDLKAVRINRELYNLLKRYSVHEDLTILEATKLAVSEYSTTGRDYQKYDGDTMTAKVAKDVSEELRTIKYNTGSSITNILNTSIDYFLKSHKID